MLIHLEKLGKTFGEKVVLHDVTASVEREDRIGIVGQNGAGKTTLLKILTGEYQDYEGEFSVTHGVTLGYLEQNAKLDVTLIFTGRCAPLLPRCWMPWRRCRFWNAAWLPSPITPTCWHSTMPCKILWTPPTATTWT